MSKPMSEKQHQLIKEVQKSLGITFRGTTAQEAYLYLQENMPKMNQPKPKKPMSEKQRKAIEAVEQVLEIKYEGEDTAQGAFLFLNEYVETANAKINAILAEERRKERESYVNFGAPIHYDYSRETEVLDKMTFYRYDDTNNLYYDDEDDTYPETPTIESLTRDISYYLRFL